VCPTSKPGLVPPVKLPVSLDGVRVCAPTRYCLGERCVLAPVREQPPPDTSLQLEQDELEDQLATVDAPVPACVLPEQLLGVDS
jgi:hypothetical protein